MRILYSWLKDFIDVNYSAEELAGKISAAGIEVAEIIKTGADFDGVVTAKILNIGKHPNADKLALVDVDYGKAKTTVVCGAKNIAVGQIVPLALDGARLGAEILRKTTIRGVESGGMLCSGKELGLAGGNADGIEILGPSLQTGIDVRTLYPQSDVVFELEITPNRGDLLSHYGIARELSAYLGIPLKPVQINKFSESGKSLKVEIIDAVNCPRYTGRTVKNVSAAQSPKFVKERLLAMGVNPKNILIDATNYVLFELGQPLHAFDLRLIKSDTIIIRPAKNGENFETLKDDKLVLDEKNLVIADGETALALAGVMGGKNSAIAEDTKDIFIESAYFNPPSVNMTARKFNLKTDSSYRFERGVDCSAAKLASDRALSLILSVCPAAQVCEMTDAYPVKLSRASIKFTADDINKILGTKLEGEKIFSILKSLDPKIEKTADELIFHPPSHRPDLNHKWDLAEECARFAGYGIIEDKTSGYVPDPETDDDNFANGKIIADSLTALGFYEVKTYDFVSVKDLSAFGFPTDNCPALLNPLSADWTHLRPTILTGIIDTIVRNGNAQNAPRRVFEIASVYEKRGNMLKETVKCAGAICGEIPNAPFWRGSEIKKTDGYHLKGILANVFENFAGVRFAETKTPPSYIHPNMCMSIANGNKECGFFGKLHPQVIKTKDIKTADIFVFEFGFENFIRRNLKFKQYSQYPSSWRDLSFVMNADTPYSAVANAVKTAGGQFLKTTDLIDVYQGKPLEEGTKSLTLRLTFSSDTATLTDAQLDKSAACIIAALASNLNAKLRS